MKIFTETAIASIKANEEHELRIISFALGLLGARVHLGTDFVDYSPWYVGNNCRQYINVLTLRAEGTCYTAITHLEAAAKAMETEIARHEDFADLTSCILSEGDGVRTIREWAAKCGVDSIILLLIEAIIRDAREGDDDGNIFLGDGISDARNEISKTNYSLLSVACVLVSAWEETETKKGWGK